LQVGDRGADVLVLQERLRALGYWTDNPDGVFGELTRQAVYAVQKAAGISRDGVVGPQTIQALERGTRPSARNISGHAIQIDLARQLLLVTTNGNIDWILNTATGGGYTYWDGGQSHRAITPTGSYAIFRQVDGWDRSPLGMLWRPKYFVGGIAIHGYESVPPYPASHGCVRVSIQAMDWIWATGQAPIGTRVIVY
jgi:lipoprotein-anchoring transpeptidase ErfK/SrfK